MPSKKSYETWTTHTELAYIKDIGAHMVSKPALDRKAPQSEQRLREMAMVLHKIGLLKKYIKTLSLRSMWGGMDKITIRAAAELELSQLQRRAGKND